MRIAVAKELDSEETRVAITPEVTTKYRQLDIEIAVESGIGAALHWSDDDYKEAGADIIADREQLLAGADLVLRVGSLPQDECGALKKDAMHVSFLDPFKQRPLIEQIAKAGISALSMEMLPRSTRAQKMDALSSQHSLAGYYMVILAAERLGKALPMMMTPAGTIQPARVLVIGAGVAGLQAIATAKRLGARVEAFDTRAVVAEQVESLGARFIKIDLGETGQTEQGYAQELTDEQKDKQRQGLARACAQADIVITTAALFGRPAPVVVDSNMLDGMRAGAIVVDYAARSGGNVAGSRLNEEVDINGVRVIGFGNYPGRIANDCSRMYASNLFNFVDEFYDKDSGELKLKRDDEIIAGALITHGGEIVNPVIRKHYELPELSTADSSAADESDNSEAADAANTDDAAAGDRK